MARNLHKLFRWQCIIGLCFGLAVLYVSGQAILYSQDRIQEPPAVGATPWDHLTLEGALVIAIGALASVVALQYRENRSKEAMNMKLATDAATTIAKATSQLELVAAALERFREDLPKRHQNEN
jgi:hypothetical protein